MMMTNLLQRVLRHNHISLLLFPWYWWSCSEVQFTITLSSVSLWDFDTQFDICVNVNDGDANAHTFIVVNLHWKKISRTVHRWREFSVVFLNRFKSPFTLQWVARNRTEFFTAAWDVTEAMFEHLHGKTVPDAILSDAVSLAIIWAKKLMKIGSLSNSRGPGAGE